MAIENPYPVVSSKESNPNRGNFPRHNRLHKKSLPRSLVQYNFAAWGARENYHFRVLSEIGIRDLQIRFQETNDTFVCIFVADPHDKHSARAEMRAIAIYHLPD